MTRIPLVALALLSGAAATTTVAQTPTTLSTIQSPAQPGQPGQAGQPASGTTTPPTGTTTLRGHVLAADTGQPIRKAQVRMAAPDIRENRMATTDEQGRYEFTELRAGRYTINASKGGYATASYGQQRPSDPGTPLTLLDNQTVERVDMSLVRGSVITGRVVDEFGEPMPDVQVSVQRYMFVQGQRRLFPAGGGSSNDIGEFRLFGITPGQYYLSATWRPPNPAPNTQPNPEDRTTYAPWYFPGSDNVAQAQRITLTAGQEMTDVVFAMKPLRAARVIGTAVTSDGRPMTGSVMVMSNGGFGFSMSANAPIRPDGTFTVNGLSPGDYTLRAQSFNASTTESEGGIAKITVNGEDITDLHIAGVKPSAARGRIVVDPAAAAALPSSLELMANSLEPAVGGTIGTRSGRVSDDGTFEMKAGAGRARIVMINAPVGWAIRAVRVNGVDVTDTGIDFKPNEDVNDIDVELTNKLTSISGLVTNARGEAVKDYWAIAFSQDRANWTGMSRYQGSGRPDQDGRFKIANVPPGPYFIVAIDHVETGEWNDPDFLDSVRSMATAISLNEGETKAVDMKINTKP
jgi:protocatechuate 3,4-dioxygenase beta subunit